MSTVTAVIATSSASEMQKLRAALATDPDIRLIGQCPGLMETFDTVERMKPTVVLIARDLTLVPEFELMPTLFETLDVRWLVIDRPGPLGASRKAGDLFSLAAQDAPARLIQQIRAVTRAARSPHLVRPAQRLTGRANGKLILIGASTGGIDALVNVLSTFPPDCPPTVIVQHTGKQFGPGLVQVLSLRCAARVVACADGGEIPAGTVCVAAGTAGHAVLSGFNPPRIAISPGSPVSGHVPSIDQLFLSAVPVARTVVAVVLTGMGSDGAAGLLALRKAGATTLSQDEATSVVYGMPRVAWETGASERQLPLNRIGPALLQTQRVTP